jgi:sugar phosphate isomerase/epimerase
MAKKRSRTRSSSKRSTPKAKAPAPNPEGIRIGTLAHLNDGVGDYLRQILPYGFESFGLTTFNPSSRIAWARLADKALEALEGSGAVISSLGVFGNPLGTAAQDKKIRTAWKEAIDNCHRFGCDIVAGFAGRVVDAPIDESIDRFKKIFGDLARRARDRGVRLAFENCDMGGDWSRGGWNIAQNPTAWEMMFDAVPYDNVGLQWEPCHQMVSLIDPIAQLRTWAPKVFHVHGKDATVMWDVVREHGVHGPHRFAYHRTPGFGDSDWTDIITILRQNGFSGSIDIEGWHDPVYRGELEMTGQVHALQYLQQCRGGTYVPNPA